MKNFDFVVNVLYFFNTGMVNIAIGGFDFVPDIYCNIYKIVIYDS